jgi:hypothetical protein
MKPIGEQKFQIIDVRSLMANGHEPLPVIRAQVEQMPLGHGITVVAPFMPAPLIELLRSEGLQSSVEHRGDRNWAVSFWRE